MTRLRVQPGQAFQELRMSAQVHDETHWEAQRFYVASAKPADLPFDWTWCQSRHAPFIDDVEMIRPYNDPTVLGSFVHDGESSFTDDELRAATYSERPGIAVLGFNTALEKLLGFNSPTGLIVNLRAHLVTPPKWEALQLSQAATDALISTEILRACQSGRDTIEFMELATKGKPPDPIVYNPPYVDVAYKPPRVNVGRIAPTMPIIAAQRGGIHSDPLVRIFAYRVWGDRDRLFDFEHAAENARIQREIWLRKQEQRKSVPIHNIPKAKP